jgi:hypothetical protein
MNETIHDFLQRMETDGWQDSMTAYQRVNSWQARLRIACPTRASRILRMARIRRSRLRSVA